MVGCTGIEPVMPEAPDLQSSESPLILPTHNALFQMRVIKHTVTHLCDSLVAVPYALLRRYFLFYKKNSIHRAARLH